MVVDVPFEKGNQWKASLLTTLFPYVSVLVDDNPSVMKSLPVSYPGKLLLYSQQDSTVPDELRNCVIACPTWDDVLKALESSQLSIYW